MGKLVPQTGKFFLIFTGQWPPVWTTVFYHLLPASFKLFLPKNPPRDRPLTTRQNHMSGAPARVRTPPVSQSHRHPNQTSPGPTDRLASLISTENGRRTADFLRGLESHQSKCVKNVLYKGIRLGKQLFGTCGCRQEEPRAPSGAPHL